MVLLLVFCTSQMLLFEFGLSNTVARITRLEPLERDNQGSSLIISRDIPRFFGPNTPPKKNSVRLGAPDTRGFCVAWFTGGRNYANGTTRIMNIIFIDDSAS